MDAGLGKPPVVVLTKASFLTSGGSSVRSNAFGVVGKSADHVSPPTEARPDRSTATP
jgi:hypothetical protein